MTKRLAALAMGVFAAALSLAGCEQGSEMAILDVQPRFGSTAGEVPVRIIGKNFRQDIGYTVYFGNKSATASTRDFDDASACDLDAYGRFCRAMLDRGIYPPPSQFEAWFVSLAHDRAAIERTVDAARESFAEALG